MSVFPTVVIDQAHSSAWALNRQDAVALNPANPADSSLQAAADAGIKVVLVDTTVEDPSFAVSAIASEPT